MSYMYRTIVSKEFRIKAKLSTYKTIKKCLDKTWKQNKSAAVALCSACKHTNKQKTRKTL